jgi:DNA-binding IclR family transcriptional regulator
MMTDAENKQKILDCLMQAEGKGVLTTSDIGKAVDLKRKECSRLLRELENEGKVASAGVMAGVAGYKAVK